ncbi:MAG: prepilin-type N-terminal cleavage/methylation domain-containing protein [Holophagales bacterium]|nr:prepilin-type N-terminal cleavage/methylation domain-containing protein [Holophagales bacterium]
MASAPDLSHRRLLPARGLSALRRRSRAGRAFTLLEMFVALAILALVFMITWRVVLDSQARLSHSSRVNFEMPVDQIFTQIRLDVRGSRGFTSPFMADVWEYGPLELFGHFTGEVVRYEKVDRVLRRAVYVPGALDARAERVMLDNVRAFRWRRLGGTGKATVEVEVTYEEVPPLTGRRAAGQLEGEPLTRVRRVVAMPRDVQLSRWW